MELVKVGGLLGKGVQRDTVALLANADAGYPGASLRAQLKRLRSQARAIEPKLESTFTEIKADGYGAGGLRPEVSQAVRLGYRVVDSDLLKQEQQL